MHTPPAVGLRGLRAAVFGSVTLVLAATAHVLAGGPLPSLPLLALVGVPLGCASVVLARRNRGPVALLGSLALAQLVLHEAFMTGAATTGCAAMPASGHLAHAGHGVTAVSCSGMPSMASSGAAALPSTWMVLLHAIATLATAALLVHGERVASRLWTWMRPRLAAPAAGRLPAISLRAASVHVAQLTAQVLATSDLSRRGPPVAHAVHVVLA